MPLFDLFWAMLWFFLFVAWIWVLISVFGDLFRDQSLSGWGKAFWALFILLLPWLGVLIYLIARGGGMAERRIAEMQAAEEATAAYIRETAGGPSVADELVKLAELRDAGTISADEFEAQKARLLG